MKKIKEELLKTQKYYGNKMRAQLETAEKKMKLGEVCFLTNDVVRLADFYKSLFEIDNRSNNEIHKDLISTISF